MRRAGSGPRPESLHFTTRLFHLVHTATAVLTRRAPAFDDARQLSDDFFMFKSIIDIDFDVLIWIILREFGNNRIAAGFS